MTDSAMPVTDIALYRAGGVVGTKRDQEPAADRGLAGNAAREFRIPMLVSHAAQQTLRRASHGYGRRDFTFICQCLDLSGDRAPV